MNQFKKAKQKALESGHQVENNTDIQTAGIKQPVEEKKIEIPSEKMIVEPAQPITPEQVVPAVQPVQAITPEVIPEPTISEPIPEQLSSPIVKETVVIEEPVYKQMPSEPTIAPLQAAEQIPVPVRVAAAPIVQETSTYTAPTVTPSVSASKTTTTKKSIPNIFAPKNEAKSMRKSLVLKPTSVKIAENYCSKNGGSFNELIQTLLDNFIDEYGL